ncbi:type II toxin-antitoxin system VapB family antitoxin [Aquipuribacter sp. SD81]|uniref:type II toxin-antitoxin system VapB family antitoxin n=1 Tax=Aquipuribacter sp. SD81 TaxID=3127703 RepID=UPI003018A24D
MARTNIDLDEAKVRAVMRRYGLSTKTEAVDIALTYLSGQPLTIDEALGRHGARDIDDVPAEDPVPHA